MMRRWIITAMVVLVCACSSTTVVAPLTDAGKPVADAGGVDADPMDAGTTLPDEAATDAGYCYNPGMAADAEAATVFGSCIPHDAEEGTCVEYSGIGVSFAEATVKANCTGASMGTWAKDQACTRTNLAGGCRQISLLSRLCETVVTHWYFGGGDAGVTPADVKMRCAAQGNAQFITP